MAWISPNVAGPAMRVLMTPWGGVARAILKIMAPAAQTTRAPANIRFNVLRLMIEPPTVRVRMKTSSLGAQTERQGDAEPVRGLLEGKAAPAALHFESSVTGS